MARALCSRKRHIISADVPKNYRDTYREILTADANVVDLHKLGPYYYCFGTHLLKFEQPDAADISKSLVKVSRVVRKSKFGNITKSRALTLILPLFFPLKILSAYNVCYT